MNAKYPKILVLQPAVPRLCLLKYQQGFCGPKVELHSRAAWGVEVLPSEALNILQQPAGAPEPPLVSRSRVITLLGPADGSDLCCRSWPQLLMVVRAPRWKGLKNRLAARGSIYYKFQCLGNQGPHITPAGAEVLC